MILLIVGLGGFLHKVPLYLFFPDSGDLKIISDEFLKGFTFAVKDNYDFIVIREDTNFEENLKKVISKNPKIIIGPLMPNHQRISADLCMRNKIINIIPIAYDIKLGDYGNYVYPFNYKLYAGLNKFLEFLREKGDTSFILFYENTINGLSIKKFLSVPSISIKNSKITADEVSEVAKDIKDFKAVLFSDNSVNSVNFYLNLRKMGYKSDAFAFDSWLSQDVISLIIGMLDNLYIITLKNVSYASYLLKLDDKYKFIEKFKEIYGSEPSQIALVGYDTGVLVLESLSESDVKTFLLKYGIFSGISGDYLLSKDFSYIKILKLTQNGMEEVK
jgi:ABC-type branched-subunit amino acid transport system substrate-binding protein